MTRRPEEIHFLNFLTHVWVRVWLNECVTWVDGWLEAVHLPVDDDHQDDVHAQRAKKLSSRLCLVSSSKASSSLYRVEQHKPTGSDPASKFMKCSFFTNVWRVGIKHCVWHVTHLMPHPVQRCRGSQKKRHFISSGDNLNNEVDVVFQETEFRTQRCTKSKHSFIIIITYNMPTSVHVHCMIEALISYQNSETPGKEWGLKGYAFHSIKNFLITMREYREYQVAPPLYVHSTWVFIQSLFLMHDCQSCHGSDTWFEVVFWSELRKPLLP